MSAIPATAAAVTPPRSRNRAWAKFKRNRIAMLGLGIVLFFVLVAILAPFIVSQDPLQTSFTTIRKAPSAAHWLGTDELGRDIYSRMVYGARASLMAGLVSVLIALVVGVPFGLAAGYFGGWTDSIISRATEALLAIPFLILLGGLGGFLVVPMNALLQHRGHNLMGAGRSIAVQNFNEQACILALGAFYALSTKFGLSAFGAITVFGLVVAGIMWLIGRWHVSNVRNHPEEVERLLVIARKDCH